MPAGKLLFLSIFTGAYAGCNERILAVQVDCFSSIRKSKSDPLIFVVNAISANVGDVARPQILLVTLFMQMMG